MRKLDTPTRYRQIKKLFFLFSFDYLINQKQRAELLFMRFPKLKQAYDLGIALGDIFNNVRTKK